MMEAEPHLVTPYGGRLVNLLVHPDTAEELRAYASRLPSLQLSERSACDLELLAIGAFSPLDRFMGRLDHERVLEEMRLTSGHLFPIPIGLPVEPSADLHLDADIALRTSKNDLLAILSVEEIYDWDRDRVADQVFGTRDLRHPLVVEMRRWGPLNLSGRLRCWACRPATTSASCASRQLRSASGFSVPGTAMSSPFRRATRCTAFTRSSPSARWRQSMAPCCCTPASA